MMSYPITQRMISSNLKTFSLSEIKVISSGIKELERTGISNTTAIKQTHLIPLTQNLQKTQNNSRSNEKSDVAKMLLQKLKFYFDFEIGGIDNLAYLPD